MAEELRLDEVRRHRVQSKTTNGPDARGARLVERLGEDLLAGAGLALDHDGHVACASRSQSG